ncbi:EF-hand calcium-binding protein 3 [Thecamonas trahens ATCC 50062]|uniref:EF-hand calcium-binding protein 3 n=1 Tax=Thecamonas trahens ATCC 50062 TaxID=461836 RepID=A0A0L0DKY5_THETB|nr:EF-hand calcium-binding protein 3 [Thecamonas trahens ATCC 50062]KNC52028.1 EF-hand calcium-binding protein 3 [Thecamonas trahens ATCC 50062]|eukprot:XP_013755611.1 EF-hand calcium-binding protein 3 [Thecamonas trahens ATCC 50062]
MADNDATAPGMDLLLDIFRRADKNDDDRISLEEFHAYFDDGILTKAQLDELFERIDEDGSANIDHRELCEWFSGGVETYVSLFDALDAVTRSVGSALSASAAEYANADAFHQFRTRFLLREAYRQLNAMSQPLERAVDALEDRARRDSATALPNIISSQPTPEVRVAIQGSQFTYRTELPPASPALERDDGFPGAAGASAASVPPAQLDELTAQIDRLRKYVDNYVSKVEFVPVEEGSADDDDEAVLVVMRVFDVDDDCVDAFVAAASTYLKDSRAADGCLHLYMKQQCGDPSTVMFWEVWESDDAVTDHYMSPTWRAFLRTSADLLISPTSTKQLPVPATWWPQLE